MYTSEPISSQIIIKQHLEAHYRKLQCVKPYIDNKIPYTLRHRPKSRVQLLPQFSARSVKSITPDYFKPLRALPDNPYIEEIVRTLFRNDVNENAVANRVPYHLESRNSSRSRASSANSTCSNRSKLAFKSENVKTQKGKELSGDVLDRQSQKFTSVKTFTPRTLKSTAVSRIRSLDCYNPPRKSTPQNCLTRPTSRSNSHPTSNGTRKNSPSESKSTPRPQPDSSRSHREHSIESQLNWKSSNKSSRESLQKNIPLKGPHLDQTLSFGNLETEVEFLNFLSSITSDILQQGSFTNAQLSKLFRKQLSEGNSNLSLDLKRRALRQIAEQLHLPSEVVTVLDEPNDECKKFPSHSCNGDVGKSQGSNGRRQKKVVSTSEIQSHAIERRRGCLADENMEVEEAEYISNALSTTSLRNSSEEVDDEIVSSDDDLQPHMSKSPQLVQIRTPILTITPVAQLSDSKVSTGSSARRINVNKSGDSDVTVILTEVTSLSDESHSNSDPLSSASVAVSVQEEYEDDFSD